MTAGDPCAWPFVFLSAEGPGKTKKQSINSGWLVLAARGTLLKRILQRHLAQCESAEIDW